MKFIILALALTANPWLSKMDGINYRPPIQESPAL
jgi:hypothetical protein